MATMRLINTIEDCGIVVKVQYDRETQEYRVRIVGKPACDYFTTDKQDALDTMRAQLNWAMHQRVTNDFMVK